MEVRHVRLLAGGVALGVALSLVAGVGAAATYRDPAPSPSIRGRASFAAADARAVAGILDGRTRAVRAADRAAFLATVYDAPAAFQDAQERLFDNLEKLPLASWQEELAAEAPVAAGPDEVTLRVTVRYRLRDYDRAPAARTRYLTVRAEPGSGGLRHWNLVGDGTGRGLADEPDIWDGGRITVVRGRRSLVIGEPAGGEPRPAMLREIGRRLDRAVPLVIKTVGGIRAWHGRPVALVSADPARSAELAGTDGDGASIRDIAALATTVPSEDGTGRSADRIVISAGMFGRLNELGRQVVIAHELTHVATGGANDHRTPIWLIEGLADYVGYKGVKVSVRSAARELRAEVRAGRLPARLPRHAEFAGGARRLPQAYEEAWLACKMVAERFGEDALLRLYRAAGRRSEPAALHEVLGLGPAGFAAMWRDYLREELT